MNKKIYLLSVGFPFGNYEPFMNGEVRYHNNLSIISTYMGTNLVQDKIRNTDNIELLHPDSSFFKRSKLPMGLSFIKAFFSVDFRREIRSGDIKPITLKKVIALASFISKANQIEKYAIKHIEKKDGEQLIFYSYWMNHLALAAIRLSKRFGGVSVTRCHGYDLYPRELGYVIMQSYLAKNIDYIYPISEDGRNTLLRVTGNDESVRNKITVERLGTCDHGINPDKCDGDVFTIVSCSNVVALKRVNLIYQAIKKISKLKIRWIHFGDGELFENLKDEVERDETIHDIQLKGRAPNCDIMNFYKQNHVDLFVNVSTSEGIPVSIMEAMSFGIPCMATNVGGVHEIIRDGYNGRLMNSDITPQQLADYFIAFASTDKKSIENIRKNAREFWLTTYNESVNYTKFAKIIGEK